MSITALQLMAKFGVDTSEAEGGLNRVTSMLGMGGPLVGGLVVAGAAAIGLGVASVKMAGDFQASMTQLVTGAGESRANLALVSNSVLQMARDTGTSTKQLSDGLFMIESAGFHGASGLNILKAASEGAKVGNADLGVTSDALTTILKDYPKVTNGASGAMNTLIATVAQGKTHMQDLASSLSEILPTASAAGVGLSDIMGAMATLTGEGIPAANAATYLRQTILALDAPSKKAADTLASIGLSTSQVSDEMKKSLPDTIQMIQDALAKKFPIGSAAYVAALKDIAGGSKTMQGLLDLTGAHLQDFKNAVGGVTDQVKKGGTSIVGWSDVQKDFNFQLSRVKEVAETAMIGLGTKLLPVATELMQFLAGEGIPTISTLVGWFEHHVVPILDVAADVAEHNVLPAFKMIWQHIAQELIPALEKLWNTVSPILIPTFRLLGWVIQNVTGPAFGLIISILSTTIGVIANVIGWLSHAGDAFRAFGGFVGAVGRGIGAAFRGGINDVIGAIDMFIGALDALQIHIPSVGVGPLHTPAFDWAGLNIPQIPMLASGGDVLAGGVAILGEKGPEPVYLPTGARVAPNSSLSGGGQQTIIIQLDGRVLTQQVIKNMPREIRLATGTRSF